MTRFDENSGIRERLALLAARGADLEGWQYDSHRDRWTRNGRIVEVRQEGSASLDIIKTKFNLNRKTAMARIGYPEV